MTTRETVIPASEIQQQFWLAQRLEPLSTAYHIPTVWHLSGTLDLNSLSAAFEELCRRHEALRTTFQERDGKVFQVVHAELRPDFSVQHDTSIEHATIGAEVTRPFNLVEGPLLRVRVFVLSERKIVLVWTLHHIICDLASKDLMAAELSQLYDRCRLAQPLADFAPALRQYRQFCDAETQWLGSDASVEAEQYFRSLNLGTVPALELPSDGARPNAQAYRGATVPFAASEGLSNAIRQLALQLQTKPFLVWLAAYALALARFSGEERVTIGVPFSNRRSDSRRDLVGCCVNNLPVCVQIPAQPVFSEVLRDLRRTMLEHHRHQEMPLSRIVSSVQARRDHRRAPLFQAGFTFEPPLRIALAGLDVRSVKVHTAGAQLDLFLTLWSDDDDRFAGHLEYATGVASEAVATRLVQSILNLLQWLVEAGAQEAKPVTFPLAAMDSDALANWNATRVDFEAPQTLPELIEAQVRRTPNHVAIRWGEQSLSYVAFYRRACDWATTLRARGINQGDTVALFFERSLEMVVGIYACVFAGAVYVPIDPEYPSVRVGHMLERSQPRAVLLHEASKARWVTNQATIPEIVIDDVDREAEPPQRSIDSNDAVYIIFTSGSTGRPKGAINTHRGICNRLLWMQSALGLRSDDVVLQKTPYSFDVSTWEFFWPLVTGATLQIAPAGLHRDPSNLLELMRRARVTTVHFVPSMLAVMLDAERTLDCASLRRVICSGEALNAELVRKLFAASNAELHNLYGPTEAAVDVSWWPCTRDTIREPIPIGYPIANTQLHVLDSTQSPVPIGVAGELYIGGVQVGLGYVRDPELTAERFIADPFSAHPHARLYRTGDRARWNDDGTLAFLGRFDDQVKIRGLRIELGEIESVLNRQPGVSSSVVVPRVVGAQVADTQLYAYVAVGKEASVDSARIKESLRAVLPAYMVPTFIICLDSLPLNASGKVDRKALPDMVPPQTIETALPSTDLERWLVQQIQELIGSQIGVNQSLFEAGGSSLTAAQIGARVRSHLQIELPLVRVFEYPTPASLAAFLAHTHQGGAQSDAAVQDARARAERRRQMSARRST
jgi:amino acid adenylation domain-containing protein